MLNEQSLLSNLVKIVCVISGVLGIFALASLVTAIILNAKSLDYASTYFSTNLLTYKNNPGTRNQIDLLQVKYACCGTDMWVDWAAAELGTTSTTTTTGTSTTFTAAPNSSTTGTSTTFTATPNSSTTGTSTTFTVAPNSSTTGTSTAFTAVPNSSTTSITVITNATSSSAVIPGKRKRDVLYASSHLHGQEKPLLADVSRVKRQAAVTYGGIEGLPLTFGVTLPSSCCTSGALLTSNTSNSYCVSNANGVANHFNTAGCAKPVGKLAGNQAMGFGIINSFMVVLAFVAIPVLLEMSSEII